MHCSSAAAIMSALSLCCFLSLTLFGFTFYVSHPLFSSYTSLCFFSLGSFLTPVTSCTAQKIIQLVIDTSFSNEITNSEHKLLFIWRSKEKMGNQGNRRMKRERIFFCCVMFNKDNHACVCVCFELTKAPLVWGAGATWLAVNQAHNRHLNYHLCQIHKTHILSQKPGWLSIQWLFSTVSINQIQIPVWNSKAVALDELFNKCWRVNLQLMLDT